MTASDRRHRDENFPVASLLLRAAHRAPVMAFYRFARAADDIADDPGLGGADKRRRLAAMRAGLDGEGADEAMALARVTRARGLDARHAHALLDAFEADVHVNRYADWDALIGYCAMSAMPVGRFVLDLHGEDRVATWPLSDALCAALQVVNHLQDCGCDYRALGRVYLPQATLARHGARDADLGRDAASPPLLAAIGETALAAGELLRRSAPLARTVRDARLATEIAVIQRLAEDLAARLRHRDPLSARVHHRRGEAAWLAVRAVVRHWARRRR